MNQLTGENEEQFQMLLMALEGTGQGICLFQSDEQSEWVALILQHLGKENVITHNIADDDEKNGMPDISDFRHWAASSTADIVIIYQLQLLGLRFGDTEAVERLNYMRDQIQHIGKLFLFGVTPYFALLLSRSARDLYSCIRYHFKFSPPVPAVGKMPAEDIRQLEGDDKLEIEKYWEYKKEAQNAAGDEKIRLSLECMSSWLTVRGMLPFQETNTVRQMAEITDMYYRKKDIELSRLNPLWLLADTWVELESREKGLYWYRLISDKVKTELGSGHLLYAAALIHFANYYNQTGNYEQCELCYDQAIAIYEENETSLREGYSEDYREALLRRAILYRRKSQFRKALAIYETILEHDTAKYGVGYYGNAVCLNNMGRVYEELYDTSSALAKYQEALQLILTSGKKNHLLPTLYLNISCIYWKNGDTKNAWNNIKLAKKMAETLYGTESIHFIPIYTTISAIWKTRQQPDKALEALRKALTLVQKAHVEETEEAAFVYHNMGNLLTEQGQALSAVSFLQKALQLRTKIYGEMHALTASTYEGLCQAFCLLADYETAKKHLTKARNIYAALYGPDNDKAKYLNQLLTELTSLPHH